VIGTDLVNPDFVAYARAFGAHGALVERTEEFPAAFAVALAAARPALIELRTDPTILTPRSKVNAGGGVTDAGT
jgi:acetolactate synthase I/II/III large subunit